MRTRRSSGAVALVVAVAVTALVAPAAAQEEPTPTTGAAVATGVTTTTVTASTATTTTATTARATTSGPASPDAPAGEEAPTEGGRAISGTISGIDGRFVNAQISLVLRRADGTFIGLSGLPSRPGAYADTISINRGVPLEGADPSTQGLVDTWAFTGIPANAHDFTLEVYPRGPGFPEGNWSHYGGVSKRRVVIPAGGLAGVRLRLPLNCDQPNGTTGAIQVHNTTNGSPTGNLDNFLALSENNPPSGIQGFRAGTSIRASETDPIFDGIAPDQRYSVNIYRPGPSLHSFYEVPVHRCQTTHVYSWRGRNTKPPRYGTIAVSQRGSFFPVAGEFSGDRRDDIFWYAPSGPGDTLSVSSGAAGRFASEAMAVGTGYRPVSGDWNGDGLDDIFWYGPGASQDRIWRGGIGGDFTTLRATAGGNSNVWPVAGDFDGNGYSDILFAEGGRSSTLRRYNANGYVNGSASVPANSQVRSGDIDGDSRDDLVWHDVSTGAVQVWFGRSNGAFAKVNEVVGRGAPYRPILADISGDFRADLVWYAPGSQPDRLWRGRADSSPYFAKESGDLRINGDYQPIALDLDGEGTEDIFWYAPGVAADTGWRMNLSGWILQY